MTIPRFGKVCLNGNHSLKRKSLIGVMHGYMCHLSVPLSCLKIFKMPYIIRRMEYILGQISNGIMHCI